MFLEALDQELTYVVVVSAGLISERVRVLLQRNVSLAKGLQRVDQRSRGVVGHSLCLDHPLCGMGWTPKSQEVNAGSPSTRFLPEKSAYSHPFVANLLKPTGSEQQIETVVLPHLPASLG